MTVLCTLQCGIQVVSHYPYYSTHLPSVCKSWVSIPFLLAFVTMPHAAPLPFLYSAGHHQYEHISGKCYQVPS